MDYVTFVVRILLDDHNTMAEGQITHVASQETGYFRDLEGAVSFMEEYLHPTTRGTGRVNPSGPTNLLMSDSGDADRD